MKEKLNTRALLEWYINVGVEETTGEKTTNHLSVPTTETPSLSTKPDRSTATTLQTRQETLKTAQQIASSTSTITELKTAFQSFDGCPLKDTAMNFVFADGSATARIMLIGEAPGAEDCLLYTSDAADE